jgi:hypothetical protein
MFGNALRKAGIGVETVEIELGGAAVELEAVVTEIVSIR